MERGDQPTPTAWSIGRRVSILVLLDGAWATAGWTVPSVDQEVSILVLLDGAAASIDANQFLDVWHEFQSLFSWMERVTLRGKLKLGWERLVSILVLLDGAPRASRSTSTSTVATSRGFNPCSPGWCAAATASAVTTCERRDVSILVLLDGAPRRLSPACRATAATLFQSLFSWMVRRGHDGGSISCQQRIVSILVLLDGARGRLAGLGLVRQAEFQSLFSWMVHRGVARRWPVLTDVAVSILVLLDGAPRHQVAQPACTLMGFNPCSPGWCSPRLRPSPGRDDPQRGFNPCSPGWCTAAPSRQTGHALGEIVSILVLLDGAPRATPGPRSWPIRAGFNPCSPGWCTAGRQRSSQSVAADVKVSILVLLDGAPRRSCGDPMA